MTNNMNDISNVFISGLSKYSSVAIIAHGDLDGLISAVMVAQIVEPHCRKIETVFTQPFLINDIPKEKLDLYDKVFMCDLAINNRRPEMTLQFIQNHANKIVVIDHHKGWTKYNIHKFAQFKKYIDENAKSCVSLIKRLTRFQFTARTESLIKLAHLTDQGKGSNRFNWALKINLRSNEAREQIYNYAMSLENGLSEWYYDVSLNEKSSKYQEIEKNTKEVLKKYAKINRNVMFVDMRLRRDKTVDKTLLFFTAYRRTPFVVLKFLSNENGEEYITVATNTRRNLVEAFNLSSGQPYRITIRNTYRKKDGKLSRQMYSDARLIKILNNEN